MNNHQIALNSSYLKSYKEDWEKEQEKPVEARDWNFKYQEKLFQEKLKFELDVLDGRIKCVYRNKQTQKFTTENHYGDVDYYRYEYWKLKHYSKILWDSKNKSTIGDNPFQTFTTSILYYYIPKDLMEDGEEIFVGWENAYDGGKKQTDASKLEDFETITWNELKIRFPKTQFE